MEYYDVIVVGAGPTGIFASLNIDDKKVLLIDANNYIGGKIKVSGGGRCNISNNKDVDDFLHSIYKNEKFLYNSLYNFSPKDIITYFENQGILLKEEEDNKMFPISGDSMEFIRLFEKRIEMKKNIFLCLNYLVDEIEIKEEHFRINNEFKCKFLVMATGGVSYPQISHGYMGYDKLMKLGHSITDLKPASSPLVITDEIISSKKLQGVSLSNALGEIYVDNKKKLTVEKDIIITHFGLSGPLALDVSCYVKEMLDEGKKVKISLTVNSYPKRMAPYLDEYNKISFMISDVKGFKVAFVTSGGVKLNEVNPKTLESKIVDNLYIGGEILDVHGITGGYNIGTCISEGKLIGDRINER